MVISLALIGDRGVPCSFPESDGLPCLNDSLPCLNSSGGLCKMTISLALIGPTKGCPGVFFLEFEGLPCLRNSLPYVTISLPCLNNSLPYLSWHPI
jgi:hypothetical protein